MIRHRKLLQDLLNLFGKCGIETEGQRANTGLFWDNIGRALPVLLQATLGPKVVTLCGSTRFMEAFFDEGWRLTLEGVIVLSVGVCKHADSHGAEALGKDVAERLDTLHFHKIDLSDEIFVLNVGGYIGYSTGREINYAKKIGVPVRYLEPLK